MQVNGEIEQPHMYAWSTVLHVPTDRGKLFFKATAPETIYEAALTQSLGHWFPDCMPEFVAVDTARGWMLMRDGGEPLRASVRAGADVRPWRPVIRRYAEVQIGLAEHITELLSLRLPDRRLSELPRLYTWLLDDEESLMLDREKGLTSAERQELREKAARFEQICAELAAYGLPESIDHGDFHDGNVLMRGERLTLFDWGDASVTHPFVSLRTFFVSVQSALKLDDDYTLSPEMLELLEIYLEPWQRFAPPEKLWSAYRLSSPVATVVKTLAWHQSITRMEPSLRGEYAWILPELWREFLVYEKMLTA